MGRWTMETATAVTAARDARPCQLCEWHAHAFYLHRSLCKKIEERKGVSAAFSKEIKTENISIPTHNTLKLPNAWHQMKQKQ